MTGSGASTCADCGRASVWCPPQKVPPDATAHTVVLTGATGTVQPLWREYGAAGRERARVLLAGLGWKGFADRRFGDRSGGHRARMLICRALMADPALLLLDEPFNALELPSHEDLVDALQRLTVDQPALATITVTHDLEELPPSTTHAFLLKEGRELASGPVDGVLTPGQHDPLLRASRSRRPPRRPVVRAVGHGGCPARPRVRGTAR